MDCTLDQVLLIYAKCFLRILCYIVFTKLFILFLLKKYYDPFFLKEEHIRLDYFDYRFKWRYKFEPNKLNCSFKYEICYPEFPHLLLITLFFPVFERTLKKTQD